MIDKKNLIELGDISGFRVEEGEVAKLLVDMTEIIGIMDRIKDWNENLEYTSTPLSLKELREDKPTLSAILKQKDISLARMVQEDD